MIKKGDKVELLDTGNTYSNWWKERSYGNTLEKIIAKLAFMFYDRYKPCNVKKTLHTDSTTLLEISSGYRQEDDLSLNKNLKWKVRCIVASESHECYARDFSYYLIQSNENHMLITNSKAIKKI